MCPVLSHAGDQLWMLSEMLRNPEWLQKDRSVILGVAVIYLIFIGVLVAGQRKKRVDDKYFVDSVKCKRRRGRGHSIAQP